MRITTFSLRSSLAVCLLLALGIAAYGQEDPIRIDNSSRFVGSGRYDWTVYLVLRDENVFEQIDYVEYTLHPTFPDPKRRVYQRGSQRRAFLLSSNGWGEFNIAVKVVFKDGGVDEREYWLKLEDDRNNDSHTIQQRRSRRRG